jgi:N-carbamoylputrescine amidase
MKIALIQMSSKKNDAESNLAFIKDFVKQAADKQAEIVVFPEMNLTGYFASEKYLSSVLVVEDNKVQEVIALNKTYNLTIVFGIAEKEGGKIYISQLVAQGGELKGIYRKHNTIDEEAKIFTPGNDTPTFNLGN